jgi:hypothetical protein
VGSRALERGDREKAVYREVKDLIEKLGPLKRVWSVRRVSQRRRRRRVRTREKLEGRECSVEKDGEVGEDTPRWEEANNLLKAKAGISLLRYTHEHGGQHGSRLLFRETGGMNNNVTKRARCYASLKLSLFYSRSDHLIVAT